MVGFIITILTISGLGIYSYIGIRQLITGGNVEMESLRIASQAEHVLVKSTNMETGQRDHVITGVSSFMESYQAVRARLCAPLRSVNVYASVLLKDYGHVLDDEAKRTIDVIAKNGRHMGRLIDHLRDFSRLGHKELQHVSRSMEVMVNIVIDEIRETNQYNLTAAIDVKSLPIAIGDHGMMRQVWHNLISNALKYSGKSDKGATFYFSLPR
jgi:light-regulated signal transduction histidine kinase (bacteriophytochrome)